MFSKEKNVLYILFKHEKKLILTGLIIGLSFFIFYYVFYYTPLYSSTCKIYVKNIAKSDLVTAFEGGGSLVSESGHSNPLYNFYEILKSENMSNKIYPVIKEKFPEDLSVLGVHSEKTFFESYPGLISANVEPSTDVIIFKLMWPNKKHVPIVLNEVLNKFKEENLVIKKTGETQKRKFIDKQTKKIAKKLENVRNKIKNYRQTAGIANIEVETERVISRRIDLEKQAYMLKSQIAYNKRKLEEFSSELNISTAKAALRATGIGTDPYLVNLNQNLAEADQKYAKLRAVFKDKYPEVISVKNQIEKLQNLITNRTAETSAGIKVSRSIYDSPSSEIVTHFALAQAEMVSLQSQLKTLQKDIGQLKKRETKILPDVQLRLDTLKKKEEVMADAYKNVKEKQLEARIKESEVIDNIIILNAPIKASSSKIFIITRFLGFLLLGGLLGLAAAYLKQALEDKWLDLDEMKILTGHNILGSIPWIKDFDGEITQNAIDAAYTNISSEITAKAYLNESFIISFISTGKYYTKSVITEAIAKKISEMGKTVLLIDLVPKNSDDFDFIDAVKLINKELGEETSSETITNEQIIENKRFSEKTHNILKSTIKKQFNNNGVEILNFNKIETNIKAENLNNFIAGKGFKYALNILKNHYEFIFINAPHGFILLPEIQTLKKLPEGIVLISSMETGKQELIKFVQNISDSGAKILGIIAREKNSELEKNIKTLKQYEISEEQDEPVSVNA